MYPQFLFGLLKVAEKRRSGFQEVSVLFVRCNANWVTIKEVARGRFVL